MALGRAVLKLPTGAFKLEEARPRPRPARSRWRAPGPRSSRHGMTAAQVLVTLQDTEDRRRYLNARATIDTLLWRAIPVINENDTVATDEIRYGDNDRLAARVARWRGGCWCCSPTSTGSMTAARRQCAARSYRGSSASRPRSRRWRRGRLRVRRHGDKARGRHDRDRRRHRHGDRHGPRPASSRPSGGARCTWFLAPANPVAARKRWIAGSLEPQGALTSTPAR